jgi:hypothetical protein
MAVRDRDLQPVGEEIPGKSPEETERSAILGMDFV